MRVRIARRRRESTSQSERRPLTDAFRAPRNRDYRLFWTGQIVSLTGAWMQSVAQAWLVLRLTNSPLALGTLTTIQTALILLLSLFGGVLADRLPNTSSAAARPASACSRRRLASAR